LIAAMSIYHYKMAPAAYLQFYVNELIKNGQVYQVNFEDKDPRLNYPSQKVSLPLSKLIFGFANGWAMGLEKRPCFSSQRTLIPPIKI
jgi:hypothetical protein